MTLLNIPESYIVSGSDDEIICTFNLTIFRNNDMVRFEIDGSSTSWMDLNDRFVERIQFENLNRCFRTQHLLKEIEIRNILDKGRAYLDEERFAKAIECFDEVIFYDKNYAEALILKSHALYSQGHYVKALRYYKRTLKADAYLKDIEYHKLLLKKSSEERDNFPKIKRLIFTGDEYFARNDFKKAVESYDKALANPSKFKSKILYKLLNKKATALFKLKRFLDALDCFEESINVRPSDYAYFMRGFCRYSLGLDLDESFVGARRITKDQQLYRALILNEAKMHNDAIRCIDDLLSVHFIADKMYFIALSCKISSMESLGIDARHEKDIFDRL